MRKDEEALLRAKMQPVAEEVGKLFVDAMCLRVRYHLVIAEDNGAEPEDIPEVIANAVDSGSEALRLALDKISERQNAQAWNEARGSNPKT